MAINLNDTLPAAPAGSTNVSWQEDVSGNVSAHIAGFAGTPALVAQYDNAHLHYNQAGLLFTTVVAGQYDIGAYVVCTESSAVGTIPGVTIGYFDKDTGVAEIKSITDPADGTVVGSLNSGTRRISVGAAQPIAWETLGYVGYDAYGEVFYALHLTCVLVSEI